MIKIGSNLPPPQAFRVSRKAGEAGELEARETGDEHARDHGGENREAKCLREFGRFLGNFVVFSS